MKVEMKKAAASDVTTCVAIARILNECQHSFGLHARRVKELVAWRSEHNEAFLADFWKCIMPIFTVFKREPAVERLVKFVVAFVTYRDEKHGDECDAFLEEFFGILLFSTDATNKAVRLRACQILSEVILRLNENAEVSDEVWDDVIESMQKRMQDKIPAVRVYSVRALARFANVDTSGELEDDPVLSAYRKALQFDQNAEVRRNIILYMPPSNATVLDIVKHTADVSESVRRTAFAVLAMKFPIQSLSIKQRTTILKQGLHDRKEEVQKECLKMLKDVWFAKCCQGDMVSLLKYLDVETHELVAESVLLALFKADCAIEQDCQGLKKYLPSAGGTTENGSKLMEPEEALYWRMLISYLHSEAQAKGHDAATTGGAQAAINAAAAGEKNELLDRILPATMADYVELVKTHLNADPHLHFVSRQLLLMGKFLDFSDATSRKVAAAFLQDLIRMPAELSHDESELDNEVLIGDGLSLGGDRHWAKAVAELARKVHGTPGEFERTVAEVVADLGRPCREGGADIMQWVNCLAATGFLLENIEAIHQLSGNAIEAHEILGGLLLPAAKHIHPEVQRGAIRCLGLFCTRELKPSLQAVKQLRVAFRKGVDIVQKMASKALFDLVMWHGAGVVDRVIDISRQTQEGAYDADEGLDGEDGFTLLELLAQRLDDDVDEVDPTVEGDPGDLETLQSVMAEGFAKLLLQSKVFSDILPMQDTVLAKLLRLYFKETKNIPRLRQCLAVFFDTYPSVSLEHKHCIAKAFVPVLRAEWPGIYGNESGAPGVVAARKRHATKLSKFMLQMLHQPLFGSDNCAKDTGGDDDTESAIEQETHTATEESKTVVTCDEELAIQIAAEVVRSSSQQRSAAVKSYLVMLLKTACSLSFRPSEQESIKCMRKLLDIIKDTGVATDKQATKELEQRATRLKAIDETPDEVLSDEQLGLILGRMDIEDVKLGQEEEQQNEAKTPAPATVRKGRGRRRTKRSSTPESCSPSPSPPASALTPMPPTTVRAHRASKAAALSKMQSELAPSKRAIYASSDEELASSSSSEEEVHDESDSEFDMGDSEQELAADAAQQIVADGNGPGVLSESTNCSAITVDQDQKQANCDMVSLECSNHNDAENDEAASEVQLQQIKGKQPSRKTKQDQASLDKVKENRVSATSGESTATKAAPRRRNLRLNRE